MPIAAKRALDAALAPVRFHNRHQWLTSFAIVAGAIAYLALWTLLLPLPEAHAANETQVIFLTSGTSWTVPSDWNSSNNSIEVIGGGGGGGRADNAPPGNSRGAGGGGGLHSRLRDSRVKAQVRVAI